MNAKSPKTAAKLARKPARTPTPARAAPRTGRPRVAEQKGPGTTCKPTSPAPATKAATVLAALQRERGATLEELMAATGWQAHSVRGFLSGTVRRKLALDLVSETGAKGRVYRVTGLTAEKRA